MKCLGWLSLLLGCLLSCPTIAGGDLDVWSEYDFCVSGAEFDDFLGQRVAMGDLHGDGLDDLVVCTRFADPAGRRRAGAVYLQFGRPSPGLSGRLDLASSSADVTIIGASAEDRLGASGESAMTPVLVRDLDGDGVGDLVLAAPNASPAGRRRAGQIGIFFGRDDFPSFLDLAVDAPDVVITGVGEDWKSGSSLLAADLNEDGQPDLIVGTPLYRSEEGMLPVGRVDVIAGGSGLRRRSRIDLGANEADWIVVGATEMEQLGDALAVGDLNGDGIDDLAIGAAGSSVESPGDSRGRVYLFFGGAERFEQNWTDLAETSADVELLGLDPDDRFGYSLAAVDLSGSGLRSLVVGAPFAVHKTGEPEIDRDRWEWGAVYLFKNRKEWPEKIDLSFQVADVTIYGATNRDRLGYQVAGGKFLGSIGEDLAVSAYLAQRSPAFVDEGLVAVFPGSGLAEKIGQTIFLSDTELPVRLWGGIDREVLGTSLASGDTDGDGLDDLLIGAPASRDTGGRAYLIKGKTLAKQAMKNR